MLRSEIRRGGQQRKYATALLRSPNGQGDDANNGIWKYCVYSQLRKRTSITVKVKTKPSLISGFVNGR
jgi:hypothetical protein